MLPVVSSARMCIGVCESECAVVPLISSLCDYGVRHVPVTLNRCARVSVCTACARTFGTGAKLVPRPGLGVKLDALCI